MESRYQLAKRMVTCSLPEEIVTEILERLPVKDLLRFKIVSKIWLTLILNTRFIKSHLRRALIPTLLTIESVQEISTLLAAFYDSIHHEPDPQIIARIRHRSDSPVGFQHIVLPKLFSSLEVIGSCNGIVCLASCHPSSSVIYLWNPLLNHYKKLPVPKQCHVPSFGHWSSRVLIGFGYDSISNDYKVLIFVSKVAHCNDSVVQLYSANADSWREFMDPMLHDWEHTSRLHTVVNGVMYFYGCFGSFAVSFDVHEEVFGIVFFLSFATSRMSNFSDFHGYVGMVFKCSDDEGVTLCTLDTLSHRWTKKIRLEADLSLNLYLNLYLGAGQFYGDLCSNRCRVCNVLYDSEKKGAYHCQPPAISKYNLFSVLKYTESLVSFKGYEEVF